VNNGSARVSGVYIDNISNTGYLEQPTDPDPVLTYERLGNGGIRVDVYGAVGGNTRLYLGTRPILPATGSLVKPEMIRHRRAIPLGVIGPSGSISYELGYCLPVHWSDRHVLVLQGSVVSGGQTIRTNSGSLMNPLSR